MRPDLIAGRLSGFIHSWRFAQTAGGAFILHWPKMARLVPERDYAIGNLFDTEALLARSSELTVVEEPTDDAAMALLKDFANLRDLPGVLVTKPPRPSVLVDAEAAFAAAPRIFTDRGVPIVRSNDEFPQAMTEAAELFGSLRLNNAVQAAHDQIRRAHRLEDTVAVHLRRGDVVAKLLTLDLEANPAHARKWAGYFHRRYVPDECFTEELARWGNPRVVVYSDSQTAKNAFRAAYAGEVLDIDASLKASELNEEIQRDFLEFLLIGCSRVVLGTSESLFSQLAAELQQTSFLDVSGRMKAEHIVRDLNTILGLRGDLQDPVRMATARHVAGEYVGLMRRLGLAEESQKLEDGATAWTSAG